MKFRLIFYGTVLICVYRQKSLTPVRIRRFPNPDRGDDEGREGGARQDNGLRPCPEENSALQVLCPSLSPRRRVRRSVSGRTLLLSRNSSSIWASLCSRRAATGLLFVRGGRFKVQNPTPCPQCSDDISTGQISIS